MSGTDILTDCPACGEEIPFFHTVDDLKRCPECSVHKEELFDIAHAGEIQVPDVDGEVDDLADLMTDGGTSDE